MGAACGGSAGSSTGRAPNRLVKRRQLRNTEPPGVRFIAPPNHKVPLRGSDAPEQRIVSLFVAQRFYRIYAHCAAGRDQTAEAGGEGQNLGDRNEGRGI